MKKILGRLFNRIILMVDCALLMVLTLCFDFCISATPANAMVTMEDGKNREYSHTGSGFSLDIPEGYCFLTNLENGGYDQYYTKYELKEKAYENQQNGIGLEMYDSEAKIQFTVSFVDNGEPQNIKDRKVQNELISEVRKIFFPDSKLNESEFKKINGVTYLYGDYADSNGFRCFSYATLSGNYMVVINVKPDTENIIPSYVRGKAEDMLLTSTVRPYESPIEDILKNNESYAGEDIQVYFAIGLGIVSIVAVIIFCVALIKKHANKKAERKRSCYSIDLEKTDDRTNDKEASYSTSKEGSKKSFYIYDEKKMNFHDVWFFLLLLGLLGDGLNFFAFVKSSSQYVSLGLEGYTSLEALIRVASIALKILIIAGFFHRTEYSRICVPILMGCNVLLPIEELVMYIEYSPQSIATACGHLFGALIVGIPITIYYLRRKPLFNGLYSTKTGTYKQVLNENEIDSEEDEPNLISNEEIGSSSEDISKGSSEPILNIKQESFDMNNTEKIENKELVDMTEDIANSLRRVKQLYDEGILTEEEYFKKRNQLLYK